MPLGDVFEGIYPSQCGRFLWLVEEVTTSSSELECDHMSIAAPNICRHLYVGFGIEKRRQAPSGIFKVLLQVSLSFHSGPLSLERQQAKFLSARL